jgi:hypothetical protein
VKLRCCAVLVALAAAAGCGQPAPPTIALNTQLKTIDVNGLASSRLADLATKSWTDEQWQSLLRVSVKTAANGARPAAVAGRYAVSGATLRFTPMFPFDEGREYEVVFDPSRLPASDSGAVAAATPIVAVVSVPGVTRTPSTVVSHVYPSGDTVPANQLRMYVYFSAPMDWRSGYDYVKLLDDRGEEVVDAFLPLDADFWSGDRTRYTVFFDPGRVKRGILPNRQMGRALVAGKRYTIVIRRGWRDGHGQPLKEEFRRTFTATPAIEQALSMRSWKLSTPPSGTREPVSVTFPAALDHGLMQRALGVSRGGVAIDGDTAIDAGETRWRFTPKTPWQAGGYELVALEFLEDLAGNRIGRAFEVDNFERTDISATPAPTTLPFTISGGR